MKTFYSIERQKSDSRGKSPRNGAYILQADHELSASGNSSELELLRQELRSRSNGLRNTSLRETAPKKLNENKENEEFTARIDTKHETVYLGSDKENKRLLAAANSKGDEAEHRNERYEYASESSRSAVSTVLPKERGEFTLSGRDPSDYGFIRTAAEDERIDRDGEGQIRSAAEEITSEGDRQTAIDIRNIDGLNPEEDSELKGLENLAQSVEQRSKALEAKTEQHTRKILNRIAAEQPVGDDFFDFLRRRKDEEEKADGNSRHTETEGITHEDNN